MYTEVHFWKWSYILDNDHSAFNLAIVINDKIYPNSNFESLVNDRDKLVARWTSHSLFFPSEYVHITNNT